MAEVSLYVAVITAATGIVAASVPTAATFVRDGRQAQREQRRAELDRRDRRAGEMRQACLEVLSAAGELRARLGNASQVHGPELAGRLAEIRSAAAEVRLHAVSVALLARGQLAGPAQGLADAAASLVMAAEDSIDRAAQQSRGLPDFAVFDQRETAFRAAAVAHASEADY
ncbi:MAG TPA: hypothetical protein VK586_21880 [Streptosporangiaceae bacterium]|nr:hypothetical protein [Streptosporangiaceae bacterium]